MFEALRTRLGGWFWSRTARAGGIPTWMGERVVRERINRRISGDPGVWPTDWLLEHTGRVERGLSLGCGAGALERDLVRKGICRTVTGVDASRGSIEIARRAAADEGLDHSLEYTVGDLNRMTVEPSSFEAAFFHQSLHHVERLGHCLRQVARSLAEGGYLYLDEYVGPSRNGWNRDELADAAAVWETLPVELRRRRRLAYPIDRRDPTEAIRSAEIVGALEEHFEIVERRDYGGNLLAVIHPHLSFDMVEEAEREVLLEALLDIEDELLARGVASYYTVILARPRDGR